MGLGLSCLVLALSAPVEATLWGLDWDPIGLRRIERLPGSVIATTLMGIWIFGAWFFNRLLRRRVFEPKEPRSWFRVLRAVAAGFPGLGFCSLPLWKRLAAGHPGWGYRARPIQELDSLSARMPSRSLSVSGFSEQSVPAIWLGGLAVLLVSAVWLAAPLHPDLPRRIALLTVAAGSHALGLVGALTYVRALRRRGCSWMHLLLASSWLLPLPLAFAAFASVGLEPDRARNETLSWTAYARHKQTGRLSGWAELERSVRSAWEASPWWDRWARPVGRRPKTKLATVDSELLNRSRVKLALLLADGTAAGWVASRSGVLDLGRPPWLGCLILCLVLAGATGTLFAAGRYVAAAARLTAEPRPLGSQRQAWYGTMALAGLGLGLVVGSALGRGAHQEAGLAFLYGLTAAVMVGGLGFILKAPFVAWGSEDFGPSLVWYGILFVLMVCGGLVSAIPAVAAAFVLVVLCSPVWNGLFFALARQHLRRCYEAADAGSGDRPPVSPRALLAIEATALLPFGALAVPWWLRLRDRLQSSRGGP